MTFSFPDLLYLKSNTTNEVRYTELGEDQRKTYKCEIDPLRCDWEDKIYLLNPEKDKGLKIGII